MTDSSPDPSHKPHPTIPLGSEDVPPHTHSSDVDINVAIAKALGDRKLRFTDKRLLIIYLVIVVMGIFLLHHSNDQTDKLKDQNKIIGQQQAQIRSNQDQIRGNEKQLKAEQQRFEAVTTITCVSLNGIVGRYDDFLLSIKTAVEQRTDLVAKFKTDIINAYNKAHIAPLNCAAIKSGSK